MTNLMGTVSSMRAARGSFGKQALCWFPNWWEYSEMASFIVWLAEFFEIHLKSEECGPKVTATQESFQ